MRYHYTPIRIAKISKTDNTKSLQGCRATVTLTYFMSDSNTVHTLWKSSWQFPKNLTYIYHIT